jgi:hypothetical protein
VLALEVCIPVIHSRAERQGARQESKADQQHRAIVTETQNMQLPWIGIIEEKF